MVKLIPLFAYFFISTNQKPLNQIHVAKHIPIILFATIQNPIILLLIISGSQIFMFRNENLIAIPISATSSNSFIIIYAPILSQRL